MKSTSHSKTPAKVINADNIQYVTLRDTLQQSATRQEYWANKLLSEIRSLKDDVSYLKKMVKEQHQLITPDGVNGGTDASAS